MSMSKKAIAGPPGRLFFHNPEMDPSRKELAAFIAQRGYHYVAVFGSDASTEAVCKSLQDALNNAKRQIGINSGLTLFHDADKLRDAGIDLLIFASMSGWEDLKTFRYIAHTCAFSGDIVVPESDPGDQQPEPDILNLPSTPVERVAYMKEQLRKTRVYPAPHRLTDEEVAFVAERRSILDTPPLPSSMYQWPLHPYESAQPIAAYWIPYAGSGRITHQFLHLLTRWGWRNIQYETILWSAHYINSLKKQNTLTQPRQEDIDETIRGIVKAEDYFQLVRIHEPISLSIFNGLNVTPIVLMRDPRDMVNSLFHRTIASGWMDSANHEVCLLKILEGFSQFIFQSGNGVHFWPHIRHIVEDYVFATENDLMCLFKFEDMHNDDLLALRDLMTRIGLYPHPLMHITVAQLSVASYMGSFEFETCGQRQRGESTELKLEDYSNLKSCRKGVVGDWRTSFTPTVVARFKELTGDGLVRLGYEDNNDWTL